MENFKNNSYDKNSLDHLDAFANFEEETLKDKINDISTEILLNDNFLKILKNISLKLNDFFQCEVKINTKELLVTEDINYFKNHDNEVQITPIITKIKDTFLPDRKLIFVNFNIMNISDNLYEKIDKNIDFPTEQLNSELENDYEDKLENQIFREAIKKSPYLIRLSKTLELNKIIGQKAIELLNKEYDNINVKTMIPIFYKSFRNHNSIISHIVLNNPSLQKPLFSTPTNYKMTFILAENIKKTKSI
jgi:hypothetical protein